MKEFLEKYTRRELIKAAFALVVYILWVVWLGNYWFLLGVPIVFDMYLTKKVNWTPWKKRNGENSKVIEWIDAIIFAVIAVSIINIFLFQNYKIPTGSMEKSLMIGDHLYVSKFAYGPRIPNTPLALPFMQSNIPGTSAKSYSELVQWDYKRLKGFTSIKRYDPVVFNFPEGDTVCFEHSNTSYYMLVNDYAHVLMDRDEKAEKEIEPEAYYKKRAREFLDNEYNIVVRPVDKRDNYIKRCVAVAGDSLEIVDGIVYVNGEKEPDFPGRQFLHEVSTDGRRFNTSALDRLGIYKEHYGKYMSSLTYMKVPLTQGMVDELDKFRIVNRVDQIVHQPESTDYNIFPRDSRYAWSIDNFGPIYIPKKGATVQLDMESLPFYERIIGVYEGNELAVSDSTIYINGEPADSYTFKMDYYWMMGDNRHQSLDSRYWGYVPEDHVVGKPRFIWLSMHKEKSFPKNIQLRRMFKIIK